MTRYAVGSDGKTPYERIKGRPADKGIAQFGENVHYKPLKMSTRTRAKIGDKMIEAVWLGVMLRTGEHILGTTDGVVKARTVKRRPTGEAWDRDAIF